ncbi:septum site-determining protein Ssd [Virgisporangium aliadipatigenens]|nr:septum site-determining protein Ssd [Virgisporangium aliadipatigenens]
MAVRTLTPSRIRPLLVTDDAALLDEVLQVAASAGADVEVAVDPAGARPHYGLAPIVLVGVDQAEACGRAALPPRAGVVLVGLVADPPWPLAQAIGAEHIALLPSASSWLAERFAVAAGRPPVPMPSRVVATVGGKGGAGASVLAAGLSVTAARSGLRVLLIDADPLGGGLDLVLGWEELDGLRWPGLASQTMGPVSPPALVDALPKRGDLAVLSCDRDAEWELPADAIDAAITAGRQSRDLVVIDLPRHFDDVSAIALAQADRVLLVVPAELRGCAAAARVAAGAQRFTKTLRLVVRGSTKLRPREIERALGIPVAGIFRNDPALAQLLERGEPPAGSGNGPLAGLCRELLAGLGLDTFGRAA